MAAVLQAAERAVTVRMLGRVDYETAWRAMREFSAARAPSTPDEIWLLEHPPVYTMGLKGHARASTAIRGIPVVCTDRGGDMTYHGPGQIVAYLLLDLARLGLGVKGLVRLLEQTVMDLLGEYGIEAQRRPGAPGVYVGDRKITALGLRVRRGYSYHGLALNVDMDLAPFAHIDPCGYPGLDVTQLVELGVKSGMESVRRQLLERLLDRLGYNRHVILQAPA
ncbi:MAG: octanoyltransferase [Candidatus Muproteobacteria bacterium RBG_16_64_10]|uniref:Octanoyltransferase n=1 Tax=Candidatus Muproteobacteria bacterium RBG_16_64_10 TaxID=1817757 RepID=A0A1F6T3W3_9PROT|nr:MAG: octanoyltransferase [Candidatus Muproteobacteria bacterium RBG_16_64_10]